MNETANILVVDDDPALRGLVRDFLAGHGFRVSEAEGGVARAVLETEPVDIVVLDVMMPGDDGLTIARSLSGRRDLGIVMVSALGSETDRIIGLEVGADDYLPKPFSPRELLARIRAVLRRQQPFAEMADEPSATYQFEGWTLDAVRRVLRDPKGVIITLSEGEFSLLRVFVERPQRVLSRDQLLEYARGPDSDAFDRAIDTQVSRLRRKLGSRSENELIRTVRSEGYMFLSKVARR